MILGEHREIVIEHIRTHAEHGDFHSKVEPGDPVLTPEESRWITRQYLENRNTPTYRIKSAIAVGMAQAATRKINRHTEIRGLEKIPSDLRGVLITSNHFSPLENTVIRHLTNRLGRRKLSIISQTTNFAMPGAVGFLMNYADTIPISADPHYLARDFHAVLKEKLVDRGEAVLLYPEQEMWFNYRKPRPPKNGAYFYAAKLGVPILSCFVEMEDLPEDDTPEFRQVRYILHVLGLLEPRRDATTRENMEYMAAADYDLKKACYERVYGKALTYRFEPDDIAGWKGAT